MNSQTVPQTAGQQSPPATDRSQRLPRVWPAAVIVAVYWIVSYIPAWLDGRAVEDAVFPTATAVTAMGAPGFLIRGAAVALAGTLATTVRTPTASSTATHSRGALRPNARKR